MTLREIVTPPNWFCAVAFNLIDGTHRYFSDFYELTGFLDETFSGIVCHYYTGAMLLEEYTHGEKNKYVAWEVKGDDVYSKSKVEFVSLKEPEPDVCLTRECCNGIV